METTTGQYKESVRQAILQFRPDEEIDQEILDKTSSYLEGNDYVGEDGTYMADDEEGRCLAYFVYDVLKWTEDSE